MELEQRRHKGTGKTLWMNLDDCMIMRQETLRLKALPRAEEEEGAWNRGGDESGRRSLRYDFSLLKRKFSHVMALPMSKS